MGKASRRQRKAEQATASTSAPAPRPAPFVARPFEGLPGETEWVALREIVPAATGTVTVRADVAGGVPPEALEVTVASILPLAWPGLHRADGTRFVGLQTHGHSGDASRDVAQALLAVLAAEPGGPVVPPTPTTADTPRLQDILDPDAPFTPSVHDGFDFWVADGASLDAEATASLAEANESIIPTVQLAAAPSAYWCRVGDRTHLRWILPHDEDAATDALARLHADGLLGEAAMGPGTRFLGAFRACGLLAPVWDLDPALEADAYEDALAAFVPRFDAALAEEAPLSPEARRSKAGIMSRQLTLR
ncbi:DUF5926 family protein [Agilicoccus flavus]|uniref:DUF5926 family protein n=1 Tax=Agilicoccus flavus TaxID=2775968 RepID=UPI001CF65C67|nr:DUF5926 family protein [Agilicoccus flavus]